MGGQINGDATFARALSDSKLPEIGINHIFGQLRAASTTRSYPFPARICPVPHHHVPQPVRRLFLLSRLRRDSRAHELRAEERRALGILVAGVIFSSNYTDQRTLAGSKDAPDIVAGGFLEGPFVNADVPTI